MPWRNNSNFSYILFGKAQTRVVFMASSLPAFISLLIFVVL